MKGLTIDVGDHVLLANKTERGKRKIADRWESTVYTVVDHKPKTHTYRIRNPKTGQEKVVYRNLLLFVDFLPIPEEISRALPDSVVNESSSVAHTSSKQRDSSVSSGILPTQLDDGNACVSGLPTTCEDGVTDRTLTWVFLLPKVSQDPTSSVVTDVLVHPTLGPATTLSADGVSKEMVDTLLEVSDDCEECHSNFVSIKSTSPVVSAHAHTSSTSHSDMTPTAKVSLDTNSSQPARSRFGHVIKPVDRLIHTISGQAVIQNTKHTFESVCKSMFRVFTD